MTEQTHEPTDGLDTSGLVAAGVVAAIGTFVLIVGLQALYLRLETVQTAAPSGINAVMSSASLLSEQRSKINRYGWLDRSKGIVAIPIDRAIEIVAKQFEQNLESVPTEPNNSGKPPTEVSQLDSRQPGRDGV